MVIYQYKTLKFVLNSSGLRSAWAARQHLYWRLKQEVCAPHVLQLATETEWTSIFYSWAAFNMLGPWNSSAAASCGALTSAPPGPGPSELNVQGEKWIESSSIKSRWKCSRTAFTQQTWTAEPIRRLHWATEDQTETCQNRLVYQETDRCGLIIHSTVTETFMTSGHFSCFFLSVPETKAGRFSRAQSGWGFED